MVRNYEDMARNLDTKGEQVVDARAAERFLGSGTSSRAFLLTAGAGSADDS